MATPVSSFPAERLWTEDKERALIAFFSDHSCLWSHKSESYKNKNLRRKTLEQLRTLLSAHPPPFPYTVEDIKSKFKNLRTTFQRQLKLVKASKTEENFVPQWKYYEQLMFLQGSCDQNDNLKQPPLSPPGAPQEVSQPLLSSTSTSSSCVPSLARCYWTEEQERALIAFFAEHSCLWSKKSENHNNRRLRLRLLEIVRSQLAEHNGSVSVEDVKCKFKNLRTVFNREYKAVQTSRASMKPYESRWKYYQQLLFLSESCDEDNADEPRQDTTAEPEIQTSSSSVSSTIHSPRQTDLKPAASVKFPDSTSPDHVKEAANSLPPSPSDSLPDAGGSLLSRSASCLVQDDTPPADSHCLWSEAKIQQLIAFFSEHSSLWNRQDEGYRNRQLRQSLLETLSRFLSDESGTFSADDIKTKFRNLRTTFQREHKAVRTNRTSGSEDFYLPRWRHYQQLMFLCDSCDEEPGDPVLLRLDGQASVLQPPPLDSQGSSPSPSASSSLSSCSSRPTHRRGASGEMLDLLKALCQNQPASPHAGFLKYVEECLNDTPPCKVRRLKKRIIETIHSVSEED